MTDEVVFWRIAADTPDYEAHELSGKGAEASGGRWNRPGTPMVYASASRALACLETLVHLARVPLPLNRYLVALRVPRRLVAEAERFHAGGGVGWDAAPAGKVSIDWGTAWAQRAGSLLAVVPSVIVPEEENVLVNPAHLDMRHVSTIKVRRWVYDGRLIE